MAEQGYVVYENELGEKRYQPVLPNGARAWRMPRYQASPLTVWDRGQKSNWSPILFRKPQRASRMATKWIRMFERRDKSTARWLKRAEVRRMRKTFTEVSNG